MKEQIIKIITDEIEGYTVPTEYELIDLVPDLYEKIDLAAERLVKLLDLHGVMKSVCSCGKPSTMPLCRECFNKGLERTEQTVL